MGYIVSISTFPTGKENLPRLIARPKRLPAATIWYSGASSAKYLSEVSACSHAWISSNIISVLFGKIVCFAYTEISSIMRFGLRSGVNILFNVSVLPSNEDKQRYRSNFSRIPTKHRFFQPVLLPFIKSGLRDDEFFHSMSLSVIRRFIEKSPFLFWWCYTPRKKKSQWIFTIKFIKVLYINIKKNIKCQNSVFLWYTYWIFNSYIGVIWRFNSKWRNAKKSFL